MHFNSEIIPGKWKSILAVELKSIFQKKVFAFRILEFGEMTTVCTPETNTSYDFYVHPHHSL